MSVNNIKVSVIIAAYRRDDCLEKAIASAVNQTHSDTEIIVINDSADEVWNEKIERVVSQFGDKVLYICNEENQGSARTRNIGINAATGDYITFLDDDDLYLPKKIEAQLEEMVSTGADYSVTDLMLYNDSDVLENVRSREYIKSDDPKELLKYHLKHHITGTDTMMFKREYLLRIGGFDEIDVGDEFYLMLKAIKGGGSFHYCKGCQVKAYIHTGDAGLSSGQGKIDGENALHEYKKTFFSELDGASRRYINMRHYAVLAFAHLRMSDYMRFGINSIKSFLCAPIECVTMFLRRKSL